MLSLVITMCLTGTPVCQDVVKPALEPDMGVIECITQASIGIDKLMEGYPGWQARAWTCTTEPKARHAA
jgi:hypothetical protein